MVTEKHIEFINNIIASKNRIIYDAFNISSMPQVAFVTISMVLEDLVPDVQWIVKVILVRLVVFSYPITVL